MATPRKKKKIAPPSDRRKLEVTKTYFDKFSLTARKMLQYVGVDPAFYDSFTKKQKREMMVAKYDLPKVYVKKGHCVPRQYMKLIQHQINFFIKETFVGDPSIGLRYGDYITMGIGFTTWISSMRDKPSAHTEMFELIHTTHERHYDGEESSFRQFMNNLQSLTYYISKINIRIYGFIWNGWGLKGCGVTNPFYITSTDAQSSYFDYHGTTHKAFEIGIGNYIEDKPLWLTLPFNAAITSSTDTRRLKLFIQSHALLRMKERMDSLSPGNRNAELIQTLSRRDTIQTENGRFYFKFIDSKHGLLGYLPFTIIKDSLYILSFIPLCSDRVPEGEALCKLLNITRVDMMFLGMDKLSFYQYTDFDAIPNLKNALIKAGMWHLTEIKPEVTIQGREVGKSTGVIARFFQELIPQLNKEEVFEEIAQMY